MVWESTWWKMRNQATKIALPVFNLITLDTISGVKSGLEGYFKKESPK